MTGGSPLTRNTARGVGLFFPFWNMPRTKDCELTTSSEKLRPVPVVRSSGNAHAAKFILVILFVKDVPLLAAFEDFPFLRGDSFADFQLDLFFFFQRISQNLHHLLADGVSVVDK